MPLPKQHVRSIKRRRSDDRESEEDKAVRLRRKLHHALRGLRKAIKKARTFEVQKTLKKLKEARCKDPESAMTKDLGAQLEILKHLSYHQLAHSALMTKLKKDRTLSADPSIRAILAELASNLVSPGAPGTPSAKVQSRILSSKVLASEVMSIMETLGASLHFPVGSEDDGEAACNRHVSPIVSKRRRTGTGHEKDAYSPKDNAENPSGKGSSRGHENTSGDEASTEAGNGWESGTVGASSGSVAGLESNHDTSSDDPDGVTIDRGSIDEGDFLSETPRSKRTRRQGAKGLPEFLPSLLVGFTRGDSGGESSDGEARLVGEMKKNRRGQRARRAIWEKKFGKNANHVKKRRQQGTGESKCRVPDSIRVDRQSGNGNSSSRPLRTPTRRMPVHHGHGPIQHPGSAGGQSERRDIRAHQDRPLHPSWEAKRKQKAASIVPSQGTKIVFSKS